MNGPGANAGPGSNEKLSGSPDHVQDCPQSTGRAENMGYRMSDGTQIAIFATTALRPGAHVR